MFWQVQTNIVVSLILGIIIAHAFFRLDKSELINRLFMYLIGLDILIMLLEIGSVIFNTKNLSTFRILHLIVNILGFIIVPVFLLLGVLYFECWLQKALRAKIKCNRWIYVPAIILFVLTLINIRTGWIATVSLENDYIRGQLFWIVPTITLFYLGYGILLIWRYHKRLTAYKYIMGLMYFTIITLVVVVQIVCEDYLTIWSTVGGLLVCAYVFNIIDGLQYDALTMMENKQSYLSYTSKLAKKQKLTLTAINIDLDDFKIINDRYGHQEGDEALKSFSQILRGSFPYKHRIFRMGGDEFLILSEQQNKKQMIKYMERFKERVKAYNASSGKVYDLKFSYGMDSYNSDYKCVEEFLKYVDSMMYTQKEKKKRRRI